MKLAIPVDEKNYDTNVCISFGRTPYFLIYDTETSECIFLDNSAIAATGGAGILASQSLVDNGAEVLLTPRIGENAVEVLDAGEVKIYKTIFETVKENVDAFLGGKLSLLDDVHAGFHGNGGN